MERLTAVDYRAAGRRFCRRELLARLMASGIASVLSRKLLAPV